MLDELLSPKYSNMHCFFITSYITIIKIHQIHRKKGINIKAHDHTQQYVSSVRNKYLTNLFHGFPFCLHRLNPSPLCKK
jgi:CRISPR/Cas system endoribonuclease Cas6 (RAMP superfamily)